jgi:hypothetical protein
VSNGAVIGSDNVTDVGATSLLDNSSNVNLSDKVISDRCTGYSVGYVEKSGTKTAQPKPLWVEVRLHNACLYLWYELSTCKAG